MFNRVAIFGGTFDPFTVAHRAICKAAMDRLPIDKLYVIPSIVDYHRVGKTRMLDDHTRLACIQHLLWSLGPQYLDKWEIDSYELDLLRCCQTTDWHPRRQFGLAKEIIAKRRFLHTLLDFKVRHSLHSAHRLSPILVLGSDSVRNLHTWYKWEAVCANVHNIAMVPGRDNDKFQPPKEIAVGGRRGSFFFDNLIRLPIPRQFRSISASKVREKYARQPLALYFADVRKFDNGSASIKELGWA